MKIIKYKTRVRIILSPSQFKALANIITDWGDSSEQVGYDVKHYKKELNLHHCFKHVTIESRIRQKESTPP